MHSGVHRSWGLLHRPDASTRGAATRSRAHVLPIASRAHMPPIASHAHVPPIASHAQRVRCLCLVGTLCGLSGLHVGAGVRVRAWLWVYVRIVARVCLHVCVCTCARVCRRLTRASQVGSSSGGRSRVRSVGGGSGCRCRSAGRRGHGGLGPGQQVAHLV